MAILYRNLELFLLQFHSCNGAHCIDASDEDYIYVSKWKDAHNFQGEINMPLNGFIPSFSFNRSRPSPDIEMNASGAGGNGEGADPRISSGNPADAPNPNNGSRNKHGWLITKAIAGMGFLVVGSLNSRAAYSLGATKNTFENAANADFNDLLRLCLDEVPKFQAHYPDIIYTCAHFSECLVPISDLEAEDAKDAKGAAIRNPYDPISGTYSTSPFEDGGLSGRLHGGVPYAIPWIDEICKIPPETFCNDHVSPASSDPIESAKRAAIAGGVGATGGGLIALVGLALKNPEVNFFGYGVGTLSLAADIWIVLNPPKTDPHAHFDSRQFSTCD